MEYTAQNLSHLLSKVPTESIYLNEQKYALTIVLINPDGRVFNISTANLVNLQIIDDGLLWYKTGVLVIRNPENIIEKRPSTLVPSDLNYVFRNDSKDILYIKLTAIQDNNSFTPEIDEKLLTMEYFFTIYEKKEIPGTDTARDKMLQFSFWELTYQIFYETNLDWSTNNLLRPNVIPYLLTDEERKVATGTAIKDLIKTTLQVNDNAFSTDWDEGGSKIFYNSLANNSAINDLDYLLCRHVSSKTNSQTSGDPCVLTRNRFNNNKWALVSLSSLYSRSVTRKTYAGPLYTETFLLAGPAGTTEASIPSVSPVPLPLNKIIYTSPLNSVISNFEFEDMTGKDSTKFVINYPCYYNDIRNKRFGVDFEDNTIENVKEYVQKNYIDRISSTAESAVTLNKSKLDMKQVKQAYSLQGSKIARYADARNKQIKAMLYVNQNLMFTVPGTIFRESNTFIGLKRTQNTIQNNFDNKLLGVWHIDKIVHEFTESKYTNTINAIKPHTNEPLLTR